MLLAAITALQACQPASENEQVLALDTNTWLVQTADRYNRNLPDMVDANTVLEETAGYNMQFSYYYTLLNYSKDDVDVDAFVSRMKPGLVNSVCNSANMKAFITRGVTLNYIYADKDQERFTTIPISPSEC